MQVFLVFDNKGSDCESVVLFNLDRLNLEASKRYYVGNNN